LTAPAVVWFRRDLRVDDHPALSAAVAEGGPVTCLYVLDQRLIDGRFASARRTALLADALAGLDAELHERGGALTVVRGKPETVVPAFAEAHRATRVHVSRDYAPFGRARDGRVAAKLAARGAGLVAHPGVLIQEPLDRPLRVFTPFHRAWQQLPLGDPLPAPARIVAPPAPSSLATEPPVMRNGDTPQAAARAQADAFLATRLAGYDTGRDLLGQQGTSRISAALRFGLLSAREVAVRALAAGGSSRYVAELAWRDFFAHVMWHWPESRRVEFEPRYRAFPWRSDAAALAAWKAGQTGYPLVDAGMRELTATAYMHNRARMVTASFLTKHLLIDWREGERHFMQHLADGDVASNNGGWQWAASTGTDAQPYFRIFNPVLQGERFDPEGRYVRRWVPELAAVGDAWLHRPWTMPPLEQAAAGCIIGRDYPAPIVDHALARDRVLATFERFRNASGRD
jgi:deoxyribodipyrimidine photo-lyase